MAIELRNSGRAILVLNHTCDSNHAYDVWDFSNGMTILRKAIID